MMMRSSRGTFAAAAAAAAARSFPFRSRRRFFLSRTQSSSRFVPRGDVFVDEKKKKR
jgi:hypothetical protein